MRRSVVVAAGAAVLIAGCASSPPPLSPRVSPPAVTPLQQAMLKAEICLGEQPDIPGTADVGTPIMVRYLLAHPAAGTARWVECVTPLPPRGPEPGSTARQVGECLAPALRSRGVTRRALPADTRALADCIIGAPQLAGAELWQRRLVA